MRERISSLFRVFKIWCVIIISYLIPFHVVIYVLQKCTSIVHLVLLFMLYVINIYLWSDHCLLIFRHIWSIFQYYNVETSYYKFHETILNYIIFSNEIIWWWVEHDICLDVHQNTYFISHFIVVQGHNTHPHITSFVIAKKLHTIEVQL